MARKFPEKLIRLSVARTKVRFGYASVLEVCLSGFIAGIVVFWISAALYSLSTSMNWISAGSPSLAAVASELATFFCIRLFDAESLCGAMANLATISAVIGVTGVTAAMILRYSVRSEPSDSFFRKKVRLPLDILPFLVLFGYPWVFRRNFFGIYVLLALITAFLWRCWCGLVLSFVSSFDVDRLMPKPVSQR